MFQNVGGWDRALRLVAAALMVWMLVAGRVSGILAMLAAAVAVGMVLTSMFGVCPLYSRLGLTTCRLPKRS